MRAGPCGLLSLGRKTRAFFGEQQMKLVADPAIVFALLELRRGLKTGRADGEPVEERHRLLSRIGWYKPARDGPGRFRSSKRVGAHFGLTPRSISPAKRVSLVGFRRSATGACAPRSMDEQSRAGETPWRSGAPGQALGGWCRRTPHPDASTFDTRPPSRPLHLQIEGENRSWLRGSRQVCEKWTVTYRPTAFLNSLFCQFRSLISQENSLFCCAGNSAATIDFGR